MRRIPRHRLLLVLPAFLVVRLGYYGAFGAANGYPPSAVLEALVIEVRQYVLVSCVLVAALCRPTASRTLVGTAEAYLCRGRLPARERVDCRLFALELLAAVLFAVGAAGVALFAKVPGRYVNRHSLAGALEVDAVAGLGPNAAFAALVTGVGLWGLAWVLGGVSLSDESVYWRPG